MVFSLPSDTSFLQLGILFLVSTVLAACGQENSSQTYRPQFTSNPPQTKTKYVLGVHPLHNPVLLQEVFGPLVTYLNTNISDATFSLEASKDYGAYEAKLYARKFDFALPNPYQTVNSLQHGYRIFAKMGDDQNFRGIILVRKDSGINSVSDLKGKKVSSPAPTALASTMLPQHYLQTHGINVLQDIETLYVGSQESSIMNVYQGNVAAATTWIPPWLAFIKTRPDVAQAVKVMWTTAPLPNNSLIARDDIPPEIVAKVRALLLNLHNTAEGRVILARMELSRFEAADEHTYQPVRDFLEDFKRRVRPLN